VGVTCSAARGGAASPRLRISDGVVVAAAAADGTTRTGARCLPLEPLEPKGLRAEK
jgi:hypothetical protein